MTKYVVGSFAFVISVAIFYVLNNPLLAATETQSTSVAQLKRHTQIRRRIDGGGV